MWEAFARCADRDVMVLNLDSFEERQWLAADPCPLSFVVYNPEDRLKTAEIDFPLAQDRSAMLTSGSDPSFEASWAPLENGRTVLKLATFEVI